MNRKYRKSERGFASLIALLISLAVLLAILSLVSINMVQLTQAKNESNAQEGVQSLMQAESNFRTMFPTGIYPTGNNLHYLNDCHAPVKGKVTPTVTAACQPVSTAYTNTQAAFQYAFSVTPTPGPDGVMGTSDDGYIITATPQTSALGRVTYCSENFDGLLRGQVNGTTPSSATVCDSFPPVAAGITPTTTSKPPAAQVLQFSGVATVGTVMPPKTLTLPSGLWQVSAALNFQPNISSTYLLNLGGAIGCEMFTSSTILDIGFSQPQTQASGIAAPTLALIGVTPPDTTSVTFQCWGANQNGIIPTSYITTYPAYTLVMTAVPVSDVGATQN